MENVLHEYTPSRLILEAMNTSTNTERAEKVWNHKIKLYSALVLIDVLAGAYRCYDARENVPEPCPEGFYGENCYDIEWKVQGQKYEHSICEDCK